MRDNMASSYRKVSTRWQCVIFTMIGKILTSFLCSTGKEKSMMRLKCHHSWNMKHFIRSWYFLERLCYRSEQFEAIRILHILLISYLFLIFTKHISQWEHKIALVDFCQLRFIHISHQSKWTQFWHAPVGV